MKKIFALVAVLALVAGTAYAADLNDGLTRQVWAQNKGRSVASDASVMFRVWYVGPNSPQISVSSSSVNLYENGVLTTASFTTYGTVQAVVDYINTLTYWRAATGPDVRGGQQVTQQGGQGGLLPITMATTTPGGFRNSPTSVLLDCGTARQIWCGVEATDNKFNRLKSITTEWAIQNGNTVSVQVYDGDNLIWRRDVADNGWNTATSFLCSGNTIQFVISSEEGLVASYGKQLTVCVSASSTTFNGGPALSDKSSDHNLSIMFDQF